jgi:hypothetical protein
MTTLYKVESGKLKNVERSTLPNENMIELWIAENPKIIGLDVLVIGTQVSTDFGGRIDILAIDREGDLTVIELKRDKTPRDIVAQILDYASWVSTLTTRRVHEIAKSKMSKKLEDAFNEFFEAPLPENLNENHSLVIVASEFDPSSRRIVEYLAEKHGISINSVFFNVFKNSGEIYLTTDWLLDQQEVVERSETRTKAPWSGYWYVNAGEDHNRSWEDMRKYGFIGAGGGRFYSKRLDQLKVGDQVFAYQKKCGYIGYGHVAKEACLAKDFEIDGVPLLSQPLIQPNLGHDQDNPEYAEYVVGVKWHKTYPLSDGKAFQGAFANQNIVCKLRDPATVQFLKNIFDVKEEVG